MNDIHADLEQQELFHCLGDRAHDQGLFLNGPVTHKRVRPF